MLPQRPSPERRSRIRNLEPAREVAGRTSNQDPVGDGAVHSVTVPADGCLAALRE